MSTPTQLPPFQKLILLIRSNPAFATEALTDTFSLLFEPSPTLYEKIVPALVQRIRTSSTRSDSSTQIQENQDEDGIPVNYTTLIDTAVDILSALPDEQKTQFIAAHPRIGEVKGLSVLSAIEQGQSANSDPSSAPPPTPRHPQPTPTEVLERLRFLNAVYERRYPTLVYITFVNGRSRVQIRDEMEEKLVKDGVLPLPGGDLKDGLTKIVPRDVDSVAWKAELDRAIRAVCDIAHSRLEKLGGQ